MITYDILFSAGYADSIQGVPQVPITNQVVLNAIENGNATVAIEAYCKGWKSGANAREGICPRCGQHTIKPDLFTNALSRVCNVYICDSCGTAEALENFTGVITTTKWWPIK